MKWFKKIKKWFQAEEEIIEIEEIIVDEPVDIEELKTVDFTKLKDFKPKEHDSRQIHSSHTARGIEPEARVLYQYPKGQFKFPVESDKELERNKRRKAEKQQVHRKNEKADSAVKQQGKPKESSKGREEGYKQTKIQPSNIPFRPTEIPSPIYGFNRPEIKKPVVEESIEFELEPKDRDNKVDFSDIPAVYRKDTQKNVEKPESKGILNESLAVANKEAEQEIEYILGKTGISIQNEQSKSDEKMSVSNEFPLFAEGDSDNGSDFAQLANEGPAAEIDTVMPEGKPAANESEIISSAGTYFQPEKESNENDTSEQLGSVDRFMGAEETADVEEKESEIQSQSMNQHDTDQSEERSAILGSSGIEEEGKAAPKEEPSFGLKESGEQDHADREELKPKKKHLPFNVLMLKQDRDRVNLHQGQMDRRIPAKSNMEEEALHSNQNNTEEDAGIAADHVASEPMESKQEETVVEPDAMAKTAEKIAVTTEDREITETIEATEISETTETVESVQDRGAKDSLVEEMPYYVYPFIDLLTPPAHAENDREWLNEQAFLLNETLKNFNVRASVVNVTQGPSVTRFEVQPEPGVKVNKITNLTDDIKLSLAAQDIRMEAPIPGKHTIGIEIPNRKSKPVFLREVLESDAFRQDQSPLTVALGLDISGQPIVTDLRKMPHGLIAGATGSGKSVCINTMLVSLLYKATPQELKLLLIDPKMVELAPYNRIPHLVSPVITDVKAATAALKWAVEEMERRYELFAHTGVRDISRFNELAERAGQHSDKLPYMVVIIDELADLMMMSPADVEEAICRIAQKARACGIHLIVATQRPSVDVITGLIKANIPTRIAFSVSSQVDSRTIIDSSGAEKLLGRGDMLFAENGSSKTVRLQGTFVSDDEIDQVVNHVRREQEPVYLFEQEELLSKAQVLDETDELFYEACEFAVNQKGASASSLQRRFHVGYNRASRLIEMMEKQGILSESRGSKPRDVLISEEELEYILEANNMN
ncbi:DNA translocase FtsK [Peribacillus sp. SCS-155]|uniref:DNA translocase FtsK n=1 Tax=Peribacillus sedimenti TaxID=3115297 RepID=UPI0039061B47